MAESPEDSSSQAARVLVSYRAEVPGVCARPGCGNTFVGRPNKRYCSKRCAMRMSRARRAANDPIESCINEATRRIDECVEDAMKRFQDCIREVMEDFRECVRTQVQAQRRRDASES